MPQPQKSQTAAFLSPIYILQAEQRKRSASPQAEKHFLEGFDVLTKSQPIFNPFLGRKIEGDEEGKKKTRAFAERK
ncbi:MAG: hypothetical protein E7580_08670 [Ruminococcaceae bacterium]|nr:hypothetical protein [Oscillospiraceae bacterium]